MTILYIYVMIFTIYFVILAVTSIKPEKKVRDKYTSKDSNMCVVIYATGDTSTLENLIKQLKNQNYPKDRYSIYAVLDKCDNPPEVVLETDLDVNVINVNNIEPIGKSQAYSILAEKLNETPNLDAFVFMDAKNYVDSDFLANTNYYLTKEDVFMPVVDYISENGNMKFSECVKSVISRYLYKFLYRSRARLGFTNLINTNAFVIKKEILDRIGSFDFRNKISEANYTLKLAKEGIKTASVQDIKVYRSITEYDSRVPSLSGRLKIFKDNISNSRNFMSFEYVCSLITPNWLTCGLIYGLLLSHSYKFPFIVSYSSILICAMILLLAYCMSLFNSDIYAKEYLYLFAYPAFSIWHIITNFPPIRFIINLIKNGNKPHKIEKMVTNVIVTDGKKDFQCQMELISDDGLAKVKFINKNKTYTTKNNHLRMTDAIKELSQKLDDFGLSLKICQTCKYYQPIVDGTTNMVKGSCNCKFEGRVEGDIIQTLIWNTCPNFEKENVINLF